MDFVVLSSLIVATLLGAFVQAATGFGFALLAAPTFIGMMGPMEGIGVLVGVHLVQSVLIVPRLWRDVPRAPLAWLVTGSLCGIPVGFSILSQVDVTTLKLSVGFVMIAFVALYGAQEAGWLRLLAIGSRQAGASPFVTGPVGVLSGFLAAVLSMPGPPVMILVACLGLPKRESQALGLTFFGFCFLFTVILFFCAGSMTLRITAVIALLSPAVWCSTYLGNRASAKLSERWFRVSVLVIAAASGLYAIASSLRP